MGERRRVGVQHRDGGRGDRLPHAPARVALRLLLRRAGGVPRHRSDQPHGAPPPAAPLVGRLPGDVLLPQQRAPRRRRRPDAPAAARGVPQHVYLPARHRLHPGLQPVPSDVARLGAVLHPEALRRVHPVPGGDHRHDPRDRHVRGAMGGADAAGLVPERAVLHDRRHGGVPDGGAVHGAEALHRKGHPLQAHVEADGGGSLLRRQVRRPVRREVGAAAGPDRRRSGRERRGGGRGGRQGGDLGPAHGAGAARGAWHGVQRLDPCASLPVCARDHGTLGEETGHPVRFAGDGHWYGRCRVYQLQCHVPSRMVRHGSFFSWYIGIGDCSWVIRVDIIIFLMPLYVWCNSLKVLRYDLGRLK